MNNYFETWTIFWLPIYKRQVFKAKIQKDTEAILSIKENIYKNIHFNKKEKIELSKALGIYKVC